jgi:hypothetical protein
MTDKTTTEAGVTLTQAELDKAKKDGVLEHAKDAAKLEAETGLTSVNDKGSMERLAEQQRLKVDSSLPSTFIAPLLDLSEDELGRRLSDEKVDGFIDFEHAKVLLNLERSGKNRTGYVKLLLKAIGTDDPYKVTPAGPAYTNDQTSITEL